MKKKVFKFEEGKRKDSYVKEIKQLLRNNPKADTIAGYDEKGNYIVTVMAPDWKDKLKFNKSSQSVVDNMDYSKQYGDYISTKGYQEYNIER